MTTYPITVTPIAGEPLRYNVSSQTDPDVTYLVDLAHNEGHGACLCKRFTCVSNPRLVAGEPRFTNRTSCAHVRAAWQFWLEASLTAAARYSPCQG